MRVLYLNHNVIWKSTFHRCYLLARELVLLGHAVTVFTNSPKARFYFRTYNKEGVNIVETPDLLWGSLRTGWDPANVIRRCWYLKRREFDLIHAFDTRPTVILPALFYQKIIKPVPLVIDWADWWGRGGAITLRQSYRILNTLFSPIETFFEEYFRKFADYTSVTSKKLRQRAIGLGINPQKVYLLYSGADTRTIYPEDQAKTRELLNLPSNAHVCLFPSFVLYDLEFVLKTFEKVYERDSTALLLLVGQYPRSLGEPYDWLIKKNVIRFCGAVNRDQLRVYLSAATLGLLPLKNNIANQARFPIKFGDFLAAGLPFVTNKVGDVGLLTKKYNLGIVCSYHPGDMAQKILQVFRNPKKANQLARNAQHFAVSSFSWKHMATDVLKIYTSLCS